MFDLEEARLLALRELAELAATAAGLEAADLTRPTRCTGWSVADVCSHAALVAVRQAEAFRRASTGSIELPDFPGAPELAFAQILELLRDGQHALDAAMRELTSDALGAVTPMPFGVVPTVVAIQIPVYEFAFHSDDVRHALGAKASLPPDIASAFIGFLPGLIGMLAGGAAPGRPPCAYQLQSPSGTLIVEHSGGGWVVVAESAQPLCILAGTDEAIALMTMGRITPTDASLAITGPAAATAADFKRWFPGP